MEVLIDSKQDLFANIPHEIMINILSRLPIPSVISCKCVCKSWLNLVKSLEFAKSYLSKSVSAPGLALDEGRPLTLALFRRKNSSKPYEILQSVDTQNSGHHWNLVFKFNFPYPELRVHSSADGLLLLLNKYKSPRSLFICNPITREYIKLPPPNPKEAVSNAENAFGFGVSKLAGKYKVVRMFHDYGKYSRGPSPCKCEVYTLGTGSWRSVAAGGPLWYNHYCLGVFLNGNVHWLVEGLEELL